MTRIFLFRTLFFLVWVLPKKLRYVINIHVIMGSVQPDWFIRFDDSAILRKNSPKWFVLHKNKSGRTKQTQYQCKHNRPAWTRSTIRKITSTKQIKTQCQKIWMSFDCADCNCNQAKISGGQETLFCLEKCISKHNMTIFSKNLGEVMAPFAPAGYAYDCTDLKMIKTWVAISNLSNTIIKQVNRYIFSPGIHHQGKLLHIYYGLAFDINENEEISVFVLHIQYALQIYFSTTNNILCS